MTNGQIPSWLDTSNPRVKIVTHSEIYRDKTALPTFSSPSIELNLHHIPTLSDYFIYLNDDVFFGSPVFPSDFMTESRTQFLYASWRVPQCSSKCIDESDVRSRPIFDVRKRRLRFWMQHGAVWLRSGRLRGRKRHVRSVSAKISNNSSNRESGGYVSRLAGDDEFGVDSNVWKPRKGHSGAYAPFNESEGFGFD